MSLGQQRYFSAVQYVDVVLGNSSSGILEVPFLGKPTVNIGERQKGRLRAPSILDCQASKEKIIETIKKALEPAFQERLAMEKTKCTYGDGTAAQQILAVLKKRFPQRELLQKSFYDVSFERLKSK